MKKLYMHIGVPKTGTSSLQNFLYKNRAQLQKRGVLYPNTINGWPQHVELWPLSLKNNYINKTNTLPFEQYKEQIAHSDCDTVILSSELFCISSIVDDYYPLTSQYDTTYIVYIRSPLPFAQSLMLQNVLNYYIDKTYHMSRLLATDALNEYISCQLAWIKHFFHGMPSSDTVLIKSYDVENISGKLIENFCSLVGIQDISTLSPPSRDNVELSLEAYYFLAHLALLPLTRSRMLSIEKELRGLSRGSTSPASRYRLFSRRQIESIPQNFVQDYEALGRRIGYPDLWQSGLDAMLKREECPWRQLPADRQWEIFEKLSPQNQEAITRVWPVRDPFPGTLRGAGFLPDIPEDEKTAYLMRRWCMFSEIVSESAE